jgi:hypothetical protein
MDDHLDRQIAKLEAARWLFTAIALISLAIFAYLMGAPVF